MVNKPAEVRKAVGSQPAPSPAGRSAPVSGLQVDVVHGAVACPPWVPFLACASCFAPFCVPLWQPWTAMDAGQGPTDTTNGLQTSV